MSAFDITIYGHLSFDNIYEGFNYKTSVGCMGNVWNQLKIINPDLKVKLEPSEIGESLILADRAQCKRTSISRLSLKTRVPVVHDSKISHIMYINELSDISFIERLKGYITADVCNGKVLDCSLEVLNKIDLLFISDEEFYNEGLNVPALASKVKSILVHTPNGSILHKGGRMFVFEAEHVPNVNVLGAGDKLAAYILAGLLEENVELPKVIQDCHNKLTHFFKNEKV
jgi:hypothetical protein